jgi:hypothetical protein
LNDEEVVALGSVAKGGDGVGVVQVGQRDEKAFCGERGEEGVNSLGYGGFWGGGKGADFVE